MVYLLSHKRWYFVFVLRNGAPFPVTPSSVLILSFHLLEAPQFLFSACPVSIANKSWYLDGFKGVPCIIHHKSTTWFPRRRIPGTRNNLDWNHPPISNFFGVQVTDRVKPPVLAGVGVLQRIFEIRGTPEAWEYDVQIRRSRVAKTGWDFHWPAKPANEDLEGVFKGYQLKGWPWGKGTWPRSVESHFGI